MSLKTVLVIAEDAADQLLLKGSLDRAVPHRFTTEIASALDRPIDALLDERIDAVIIAQAPETEYLLRLAQKHEVTAPLILLLSEASEATRQRLRGLGARDFLVRGNLQDELLHRILDYSIELGQAQAQIRQLSNRDPLTGALNRSGLRAHVERAIERSQRYHFKTGLLYLDIDKFTQLNDDHGEGAADSIIQTVFARLSARKRSMDSIARLGADQFAICLEDVRDEANLTRIVEKFMEVLREPIDVNGTAVSIEVSAGGSLCPDHGTQFEDMVEAARSSMLQAKSVDGNKYFLFRDQLSFGALDQATGLAGDIRQAMRRDEFELHFQPRIDLPYEQVVGLEALIRWNHPHRGVLTPDEFLPACEDMGLMRKLGYKVTEKACEAIKWLDEQGLTSIDIAVNVSFSQFQDDQFPEIVKCIVNRSGIDPRRLEFELTESTVLKCPSETRLRMNELKARGHSFSLDDFGTGFSQLSHMTNLPISALKIDRSFVREVSGNRHQQAVCMMIIDMAQRLDLEVIAEGAESRDQVDFLNSISCQQVQGYYYSPAVPLSDIPDYVRKQAFRVARVH
ncbi:MAG: EAL domain-containing protein [Halieaceae bacterium]|jgi:diguanylate cyclase (GGDEF)-like protein|nr:EAL domain-containing protein [Halieaceae bacterium]